MFSSPLSPLSAPVRLVPFREEPDRGGWIQKPPPSKSFFPASQRENFKHVNFVPGLVFLQNKDYIKQRLLCTDLANRAARPGGGGRKVENGDLMPETGNNRKKNLPYKTDSSLLRHVQDGDQTAWNDFYRKYSAMICSIGKKKHLSAEDCEDLKINVMTVFWKKMDEFIYDRNRGKFRNYLGKISEYCALRILSNQRRYTALDAEPELEYPAEIDETIMQEYRDFLVEKALAVLREELDTEIYQVFYMSFVQKLPVKEIAAVTRRSANNIYVIRSRCLKKLAAVINEERQLESGFLSIHSHKNKSEN